MTSEKGQGDESNLSGEEEWVKIETNNGPQ